ncbi:outer membrane beta-barrel protein [Flagellimonas meridianipacifica]|uniref:Outer membrane protein with beta-barrel domain n=1 Tax=Flagellimonas meridianipacifica TaxID=1080225 RepID=A0A2T0M6V6_9FLAO|nr:outer membrane beta-barrel protein [Allomuricauda pacifica]PRX53224.1 outer membrane protein with beta-barrel domain [Allomuricauda pacifica]
MKQTLLIGAFLMASTFTFAQTGTGFGIKAGLSYNENGDLISSVGDAGQNIIDGAEGKAGFHFGFWGKLDFPKLYIRPELVFTRTQSSYTLDGSSTDYSVSKLDLPVLLGYKIIGPLHVFAGPAFQYTLSNDLDGVNIQDVENDFTLGLNIGAGVNLGRLGLDVRYERGFSENEAEFISDNITNIQGRVDSRPAQVIFSLSYKLSQGRAQ